jgi:hypothetical protein
MIMQLILFVSIIFGLVLATGGTHLLRTTRVKRDLRNPIRAQVLVGTGIFLLGAFCLLTGSTDLIGIVLMGNVFVVALAGYTDTQLKKLQNKEA